MNEAEYLKALSDAGSKIRAEHKEITTGAIRDAFRPETKANPDHGAARKLVEDIAYKQAKRAMTEILTEAGILPKEA